MGRSVAMVLLGLLAMGGCSIERGGLAGPDAAAGIDAFRPEVGDAMVDASVDAPIGPAVLQPSNAGGASIVALTAGTADMRIGELGPEWWHIDTDTGAIVAHEHATGATRDIRAEGMGLDASGFAFSVIEQPDGPELALLAAQSLVVPAGSQIYPTGRRPLAILIADDVAIEGTITVASKRYGTPDIWAGCGAGFGGDRGKDDIGSPGAGLGGGQGGTPFEQTDHGGGGGSFSSSGGAGSGGAAPGEINGESSLRPIRGGSGGGAGSDDDAGRGGTGGGAIQISAGGSIRILPGAIVEAGGAGGSGGRTSEGTKNAGGGGGGGSGGAILLEAPSVTIDGFLAANGGAGGDGAPCNKCSTPGMDGADALPSNMPAVGGSGVTAGGFGSDTSGVAGAGVVIAADMNGGWGGGGAGRIRINTDTGAEVFGNVSPISGFGTSVGVISRTPP